MLKMKFLPDESVCDFADDMLGFGEFVDLIQTSIQNTSSPFVHGILGDWGTGKTSIMRLLQVRLNESLGQADEIFVPIWFNAWEYENEANLLYPLLYAVKRDYESRQKVIGKVREFRGTLARVTAISALALGDIGIRAVTKALTGEAIKLEDVNKIMSELRTHPDELEKAFGQWADSVFDLREAFEKLLDQYAHDLTLMDWSIKPERVRFVILVDDLDRCLPDTAITVLEHIKNHLTVKNCVFVLGLNAQVVYQGIRIKYKGAEVDGREYLEKFLNYTFYVPEPSIEAVLKFVKLQLELRIPDHADKYRDHIHHLGSAFQDCRFNNPRKIKRILNRYLLFIAKYEQKVAGQSHTLADFPLPNITRLIVMAEYFPTLFQLLLPNAAKADKAKDAMIFSKPEFNIDNFEKDFGISIREIFPQLMRMNALFTFIKGTTRVNEQAQAVYSITRLT